MTKPYNTAELIARVQAQLRRYLVWKDGKPEEKENQICNGGLVLDLNTKNLIVDGQAVKLTAKEYKIVEFLMNHLSYIFSAEDIYSYVWEDATAYAVGKHGYGAYQTHSGEDRDQSRRTKILKGGMENWL